MRFTFLPHLACGVLLICGSGQQVSANPSMGLVEEVDVKQWLPTENATGEPAQQPSTGSSSLREETSSRAAPFEVEFPLTSDDLTITRSAQIQGLSDEDIGRNYRLKESDPSLNRVLNEFDGQQTAETRGSAIARLQGVGLNFILEAAVSSFILIATFSSLQLSRHAQQCVLFSLLVALTSALMDYFFSMSPLNLLRFVLSFGLLFGLVLQIRGVHPWRSALPIALTTRIACTVAAWLATAGINALSQV